MYSYIFIYKNIFFCVFEFITNLEYAMNNNIMQY